jgi:hypothetical protein
MNGLNKDDIIRMAREIADKDKVDPLHNDMVTLTVDELGKLLAAEREKVAQWMMQRGYATGHGDTIEDLLAELDWQIAENWNRAMINGMKTEREACAKVCEELQDALDRHKWPTGYDCADAIRARGQE